eukprot:TRINITY_DN6442_c0_g1_i1.p1 TRINITY_DN6442_c0_g1~~TRINITY_DN6442_c0_g1_i1.p1  ORF type:complete len:458 (+),score=89.94 TRINITY_DN6442_c0_g1_i1:131-1504(+)
MAGAVGRHALLSQRQRISALAALSSANFISFADRTIVGVCVLPMQRQFGWSEQTKGLVLSAFYWGYTLTQIPGGRASERLGCKPVLVGAVLLWSVATWVIPEAAGFGIAALLAARVLLGLAEGVQFPCTTLYISLAFPTEWRARAVAVVFAGVEAGTVTASLIAPTISAELGWEACFRCFGGLGLLWCLASRSALPRTVQPGSGAKTGAKAGLVRQVASMAHTSNFWSVLLGHACFCCYVHTALYWLPTYFQNAFGVPLKHLALYTAPPHAVNVAVSLLAGALADRVVARGVAPIRARRTASGLGFFGPAVLLLCSPLVGSPAAATILWCGILGFASFCAKCGHLLHMMDVAPESVGLVMGIVNTFGSVVGMLANIAAGKLLDMYPGCWDMLFRALAVVMMCGGVSFLSLADDQSINARDPSPHQLPQATPASGEDSFPVPPESPGVRLAPLLCSEG